MIITRAPFRIPLGGGGTDLPFYAEKRGGSLITAAINRYIYVSLHRRQLDRLIWLSYSERETQYEVSAVRHRLIREALRHAGVTSSVEIHSMTELSERAGLGGSSTFLVALLKALSEYLGTSSSVSKDTLAADAVHIEREVLKDHGGIQDQYIAAHGGLCLIENSSLTDVRVRPLTVGRDLLAELSRNLALFYTGVQRSSSDIIKAQTDENTTEELIRFYDSIKEISAAAQGALMRGDLDALGKTFHEHWLLKRRFTKRMTTNGLDVLYEQALRHGALGGKLVGAGGGGFFLFYVPAQQAAFREQMEKQGLIHVPFCFDTEGVTTVLNREF